MMRSGNFALFFEKQKEPPSVRDEGNKLRDTTLVFASRQTLGYPVTGMSRCRLLNQTPEKKPARMFGEPLTGELRTESERVRFQPTARPLCDALYRPTLPIIAFTV